MKKPAQSPKKKSKARKPSQSENQPTPWYKTKYARFGYALVAGALALYLLISMVSYLFTWGSDQSLLSHPQWMDADVVADNGGGKVGFRWAKFLISDLFGLGAFLIPIFLGGVSVTLFKIRQVKLLRLFMVSLYGCIILSLTCSFLCSFLPSDDWFINGAGGAYGQAVNAWACAAIGSWGVGLILFVLLSGWIFLLNPRIIDRWIAWIEKPRQRDDAQPDGDAGQSDDDPSGDQGDDSGADDEGADEEDADDGATQEGDDQGEEAPDEETPDEEDADDQAGDGQGADRGHDGNDHPEEPSDPPTPFVIYDLPDPQPAEEPQPDPAPDQDGLPQPPAEPEIPPIEVIPGDDFSAGLSDEDWRLRYDPRLSLSHFQSPQTDLLEEYRDQISRVSKDELEKNNRKIVTTLKNYRIEIAKISARIGPTVTLYEIVPAPGVRVSQIKRLEEDIALSLAARGVRVVTLVGTNAIGIEVANEKPSIVSMRSVLEDPRFRSAKYELPVVIGRTISNEVLSFDLAKMPHLLVAGATGQGKSVGLNAIITSLLYRKHPSEMKFVLVDPKKVELSLYEPLEKHYLAKLPDAEEAIITDTQKVIYTLKSLCKLMDHRYDLLKAASVRNVREYNEKFLSRRLNPYKGHEYMPYIVVIIDEFADLLMTAGREIEEPIARLAQLARAIGIHLVIATQRPTTNIITGTIKANFPARIAFRVISGVDSKTILDQTGANQLIGRGDMLFYTGSDLTRVQCAFIDTPEVERLTKFISRQSGFGGAFLLPEYVPEDGGSGLPMKNEGELQGYDSLIKEAARLVVREQQGSASLIQRKMSLGYNRSARIIDQLEELGIVGPSEGSKARQVRVTSLESLELILSGIQ